MTTISWRNTGTIGFASWLLTLTLMATAFGEDRLSRVDLMLWRDDNGEVRPVQSAADWEQRRAEIVRAMESIMGPLPGVEKRCPIDVKVVEEVDCGTYVRRQLTYQAEPGEGGRVPAFLCLPKAVADGSKRAPAVLCLHPTDNAIGNGVVVGLGGRPNRQYASELAERGYVTIAPNYPLLASYQPDWEGLGYASGSMKAIWDNVRALDLLESLSGVDATPGFGAIGHSLGGHNSIYTAVLDERIRVVVSSCGFDFYTDYYGGSAEVWKPGKGWCSSRYMPRLLSYAGRLEEIPFDFAELLGALAPRPVFVNAPKRDGNFRWESVDRVVAAALPVYELLGAPEGMRVRHPDCDHDFPVEMRDEAYRLIDSVLKPAS